MNKPNKKPRKNLKGISETFFMSNETRHLVLETINKLDNAEKNKVEINRLWERDKNFVSRRNGFFA